MVIGTPFAVATDGGLARGVQRQLRRILVQALVNGLPDGASQGGRRLRPQRQVAVAAAPVAVAAVQGEPGADRQEPQAARDVLGLGHDLLGQGGVTQVDERPRWVGATRAGVVADQLGVDGRLAGAADAGSAGVGVEGDHMGLLCVSCCNGEMKSGWKTRGVFASLLE